MQGRILVVGPSWVGDMVMAQSLFITLKRQQPDAAIDVLAPEWSLPILERMPEVADGLAMPVGHGQLGLGKRWQLGKSLRARNYTQAIVLPNSYKSALVPWVANIPQRTGFRGEWRYGLLNDIRTLDREQLPMTVQRYVALGLPAHQSVAMDLPRPRLQRSPERLAELIRTLGLDTSRPAAALMPGAEFGPAKQWPATHFAALAQARLEQGEQVWLLGSAKDRPVGDAIAGIAGEGVRNLCGQTQLADAVDLIGAARVAVTNDSGLMHVAAALDTPVVAIFGSSSPRHTPPLAERASIQYLALSCSPCFKRVCPLGHTRCLHAIAPEQVMRAIDGCTH